MEYYILHILTNNRRSKCRQNTASIHTDVALGTDNITRGEGAIDSIRTSETERCNRSRLLLNGHTNTLLVVNAKLSSASRDSRIGASIGDGHLSISRSEHEKPKNGNAL